MFQNVPRDTYTTLCEEAKAEAAKVQHCSIKMGGEGLGWGEGLRRERDEGRRGRDGRRRTGRGRDEGVRERAKGGEGEDIEPRCFQL